MSFLAMAPVATLLLSSYFTVIETALPDPGTESVNDRTAVQVTKNNTVQNEAAL